MGGATLFEKVWAEHEIANLGDGLSLLHVDRHLMHDLNGMKSLVELRERGFRVRNPELTTATPDHGISTVPGRSDDSNPATTALLHGLREETARAGIRVYDIGQEGQGIVHVMGPELGLTQPGCLIVCGDSHTCTHGGLGALAFGVGRSEVVHVLATQTIYQSRPQQMRVRFDGALAAHVSPKDLILYLIGKIGAAGGTGCAVEYGGSATRAMAVEGRLTICNLSIELGAKYGIIAPDDTTVEFIAGRPFAPKLDHWEKAVAYWGTLFSDEDAIFDKEVTVDASAVAPQITWGTSPQHVIAVDDVIPDPARAADAASGRMMTEALSYIGLTPGVRIEGTPVDMVFIGSCTNSRLPDLRQAAAIAKGRKVAANVRAWVVPGSENVKRAAEAEGLDRVFRAAGFEWREPGCSMCLAANGELAPRGARVVSTSNRNFEGRQGPGARTHLASPAMAAAAAVVGCITDVRKLMSAN
jgi:3-isopropylmalate/(R)-2-methylmalate dehydratase large subunit